MATLTESRRARAASPQQGTTPGGVLHWLRAIVCWVAFLPAALLTTLFVGWVLLGMVLLGSGPSTAGAPVPAILVALLVGTIALAWLAARFAASWPSVGRAAGLLVALVALVGGTWVLAAPDQALYWAREMAWDGGSPRDYQEYPQRAIGNGPVAYHFPHNPSPQLFQTITYRQGGQLKQASLNDFLVATQTTSFIVIKDGAILDESYANGYTRDSIVTSESDSKSFT
jgi:hypothetical protein